ncbi:DNA polymerase Y family protein [uncultured Ferrovibrio sp.]|jgi:protein ImuB|uniref:Y-family DNA polymerase n=1 Tax=uncultured Ferrovibrio sp. TaxID=1576913 RepID=UPI00261BA1D7|nr:DNA polymerase Y family protein [uncultured Ferrovibrio sp.]
MRRFISVWLPHWPTDRWLRQQSNASSGAAARERPLALTMTASGGVRLAAVNAVAADSGLAPGMTLADARALVPDLVTAPSDPAGDAAALERLCAWCGRFSPWVATDGADGLILDISGVAHLFGGEAKMLGLMRQKLQQFGCNARLAAADTPAAAWAWARYGRGGVLQGFGALHDLPVEALRLSCELSDDLKRLGLRLIGDLVKLPRGPLARRMGHGLLERLDALFGRREEPISPRLPPAPWRARADLPEPVCTREAIDHVLRRLLDALCQLLEREQRGARRLMLHAYRVDGIVQSIGIGTSLANRNPVHLFRLYRDRLDGIDPGFGIETMLLEASDCEMLTGAQTVLPQAKGDRPAAIAQIVDRLQARLGHGAVFRQQPVESHWPERSLRRAPPFARWHVTSSPASPRPVSLLPRPEPVEIETNAAGWPSAFRWHRVLRRLSRLEGPERLAPEWWRDGLVVTHRDYFRAEDAQGRRYWLFREQSAWFLHGLFA